MSLLTSRWTNLARLPRRLRHTSFRQWWKLPAIGLPVVVVASLLLTSGPGDTAPKVDLNLGRVWLGSDAVDQAALLDGTTVLVESRVGLPRTKEALSQVVTSGANAGALMSGGAITAVSGATDIATPARQILPGATDAQLYASDSHLFAVDLGSNSRSGTIAVTDTTGPNIQERFDLRQPIVTATLDNGGRLWVIGKDGTVYWTNGTQLHHVAQGKNPAALLGTSGTSAVLVQNDTTKPTATLLDPATGKPEASSCLESEVTLSDPTLQVGAAPAGFAYASSSRDGTLLTANLASGKCPVVHIAPEGDRLGPPISAEGRVFVPNYSTGDVIIVNPDTGTYIPATVFHKPLPRTFQLLTQDNIVYYNNPFGTQAGVIKPDGTVNSVAKYDPADPAKGLAAPRLATPTSTTPTPPKPKPQAPPPTTPPTTLPVPDSLPNGRPVTAPTAPPGTLAGPAPDTPSTTLPPFPPSLGSDSTTTTTLPPISPPVTNPSQPTEPQTPATEPPPPTVSVTQPQGPTQGEGSPSGGGGGGGGGSSGTTLPGANGGQVRPEIITKSLDPATITLGYNEPLKATGGSPPYQWRATGLPNGLTINQTTGQISGTAAGNDQAGTFPITITLTDSQGTQATVTLPLTVNPAPAALPIGPAHLPVAKGPCPACTGGSATAGTPYSVQLTTTGGTAPYTWTITGLPQGFSADGDTITGTALSSSQSSTVLVKVTDSSSPVRTGEAEYTLAVNHAPVAQDIETSTTPGSQASLQFVPPDTDPDGDSLNVTSVSNFCQFAPKTHECSSDPPNNAKDCGSVDLTDDLFTPAKGFGGPGKGAPCTFDYTISDGTLSADGKVTVEVTDNGPSIQQPNPWPAPSQHMATAATPVTDTFAVTAPIPGAYNCTGSNQLCPLANNAVSVDLDQPPSVSPTTSGKVEPANCDNSANQNCTSITFTATPGFSGNVEIDYSATDGTLDTSGTINLTLTDTPPVASDMTIGYSTAQGETVIDVTNPQPQPSGALNTAASDPDPGDSITVTALSPLDPSSSTISVQVDPNDPSGHSIDILNSAPVCNGLAGPSQTFSYTVSDGPPGSGLGQTDTGTITLDPEACSTG